MGLSALVVCLATLGLGLSATARQPTFTTFDAPGAGTGADQGTIPFDITPAEEITGFTRDAAFARHGFLRGPDWRHHYFRRSERRHWRWPGHPRLQPEPGGGDHGMVH